MAHALFMGCTCMSALLKQVLQNHRILSPRLVNKKLNKMFSIETEWKFLPNDELK